MLFFNRGEREGIRNALNSGDGWFSPADETPVLIQRSRSIAEAKHFARGSGVFWRKETTPAASLRLRYGNARGLQPGEQTLSQIILSVQILRSLLLTLCFGNPDTKTRKSCKQILFFCFFSGKTYSKKNPHISKTKSFNGLHSGKASDAAGKSVLPEHWR